MAISHKATTDALQVLGITPGDSSRLAATAADKGQATGYREDGPLGGVLLTVHHVGNGMYWIEVH
jgi:hypothetical protein